MERKNNRRSEKIYLSYTLQKNGGQEAHVREKVKKIAVIIGQVCNGKDFGESLRGFGKKNATVR